MINRLVSLHCIEYNSKTKSNPIIWTEVTVRIEMVVKSRSSFHYFIFQIENQFFFSSSLFRFENQFYCSYIILNETTHNSFGLKKVCTNIEDAKNSNSSLMLYFVLIKLVVVLWLSYGCIETSIFPRKAINIKSKNKLTCIPSQLCKGIANRNQLKCDTHRKVTHSDIAMRSVVYSK